MIQGFDYASVDGNHAPPADAAGAFVIVRGAFSYKGKIIFDQHLERDRGPTTAAGKVFGSYLILGYDQAGPTPEVQARGFIAAYGARRDGELPPALDVEFPGADGRKSYGISAAEALEWTLRAYRILLSFYGVVMIYTSARVWHEDLADLPCPELADAPLWIKTAYAYKAGQPDHPEACPVPMIVTANLPVPWRAAGSAGAWINQYQGDAKGVHGYSSTVDCNSWMVASEFGLGSHDARAQWVAGKLSRANVRSVVEFQRVHGLQMDGVIGPRTFAALAH